MFRSRAWIRAFFGFSRRETNAFLILLPLMIIVLFSEPVFRHWWMDDTVDPSTDQRSMDSLVATLKYTIPDSSLRKSYEDRAAAKEILFSFFDPNTVSEDDFIKLGLPKFIATRIIRYRTKGGKFKKKDDLLRMYGIDTAWFYLASPWIRIADVPVADKTSKFSKNEKASYVIETIDINLADTTQLMKIYGIGPGLSKRICAFRDRLGGFVSMNQLKEVYGLDTAVVKQLNKRFFIANDFVPYRINFNTMNPEHVKHPYIRKKEVQAIVAYRHQHGDIRSVEQLFAIKSLSAEWVERMKPYISFD